ncbi:APC family permease [Sporolactobacillus laevolacticus]|uniref:APC family permease n=1 Tax=Sporolactobacillus laevolacticus TaxID=33018 RepID=UPI0025B573FF|nr:APC family permease [Sporolactobacillus laevolacticus]MDN3955371.1 APC family permease [Sporolactobacillus laevolacticus]
MWTKLKRLLIGRPLKSNESHSQKLNKFKALAVLSSDALSSVAYGPEQILIVLMAAGSTALWFSLPIAIGVLVLLIALVLSYRQIIFAYPQGGGAYMVAKENLGTNFGLTAGGALLVDYILTVAVSISAGTDAITSAFPSLHEHSVTVAVVIVVIITILNLRGLTDSATLLSYPVYFFVLMMLVVIGGGLFAAITGHTAPIHPHPSIGTPVMGVGLFLLLRAFSSGCSALTGVEAISNAIPSFKEPAPKNAARTLLMMGGILAVLLAGIVYLSYWYGVHPSSDQTVLSQLAGTLFGRNLFYYIIQVSTALILILAANTGYSAFPLLAFNLAKDKYMPRPFKVRGDRLGYSNGIITLGALSILLIIIFKGRTENLIPLYAVGVFIPFSLSQTGMIVHWLKKRPRAWVGKLVINLIGALICYMILAIFFLTKFPQIWPVLVFVPIVIFIFHKIHEHYMLVAEQLRIDFSEPLPTIHASDNVIVVPVAGITKVVEQSLTYAKSLSDNVIAVYVGDSPEAIEKMNKEWEDWNPGVRLITLHSLYRSIVSPLDKFISTVKYKADQRGATVTVVFPQFYTAKWWQSLLHNQSGVLIKATLIRNKDVVIATVPYHFKK